MKEEKEVENIRVAVRCRPMNERELREQAVSCFTSENGNAILTNLENQSEKHTFAYDFVYGCDSAQEQVFLDIGAPILDRAFGGYNGTIFAYGQTGSGKTFSMSGVSGNETLEGLIPRMNKAIFERIKAEKAANPSKLFLVECSFFEIYNEIIYDLLDASGNSKKNKGGLEIKEHSVLGIYVKDLQERVVESREEVIDLMAQGAQARTVGYTQMNAESSRSHSIFIIKIHQKDSEDETKNLFAKINLVDLAGSERAASTGAQGDRLKEGANINKSLSALGNVINALVEASRAGKKVFIPYRNSKLTRVLQESLGGNSLCSMLATLSPANINFPETLSTLKYASRAKSIKVNAKKNESSSQISQLNEEIAALKKKLTEQTESTLGLDPKEKEEIVKKYEKQIQEMDRVRLQTWEDKAKLSKQHELERKKLAKEKALADQKIREERTRKWKLLEEKGDVELLMRALRDLDTGPTAFPLSPAGSEPVEMRWLATAQQIKAMEAKAKDHRTLIMVFKDSLHKDVELWVKRCSPLDSATQSTKNLHAHVKRDDSAARHMTAGQMASKLQNIAQESDQLLKLENEMICTQNALVNDLTSELLRFKGYRKSLKIIKKPEPVDVVAGAPPPPALQPSKEEEQVLEEREKGLSMTLSMIRSHRSAIVDAIKTDRKRTFEFGEVIKQFIRHAVAQTALLEETKTPETLETNKKQITAWTEAQNRLSEVAASWEKTWASQEPTESTVEFAGQGEVAALGMESKSVPDECLSTSSRKQDAKLTRLNNTHYWVPDQQDKAPSLVIDFELPRVFQSVSIRGGVLYGSGGLDITRTSEKSQESRSSNPTPIVASTFVLKPREILQAELQKYKLDEISGDYEATYEILSHVMSWVDLLKTDVVPVKLFARPPVRFLHDVISIVIHNTGFGDHLFSAAQKDYAQLVSKTDRADYLTKILDFVQETFNKKHEADKSGGTASVIVAATATNVLAGKEPTDTLKFLSYLALAAMDHVIKNPMPAPTPSNATVADPSRPGSAPRPEASSSETNQAPGDSTTSQDPSTAAISSHPAASIPLSEPEPDKNVPKSCWVKKIRVATSFSGSEKDWQVVGDFDANADSQQVVNVAFFSGKTTRTLSGRYLRLTCLEWEVQPLFQIEVFGQAAVETDSLAKAMEVLAGKVRSLLQHLQRAASLVLDETKSMWDRAKVVEREKQQELSNRIEEITKLKAEGLEWEKQVTELRGLNTQLKGQLESETKQVSDAKAQGAKLQSDLQQASSDIERARREAKALEGKVSELEHQVHTVSMQSSEQKRAMEALEQSRKDLDALCGNLRAQLQNKEQQDGHQESKIASMYGELMSANVQVEDLKRKLETADQARKEQEAFGKQLHEQLQQMRATAAEKEKDMEERLKSQVEDAAKQASALQNEIAHLKKTVEVNASAETALKASVVQLEKQITTLQQSVEHWQHKAAEAELAASALTDAAAIAASEAASIPSDSRPASPDGGQAAAGESTSQANDALLLEAQTKELRYLAEVEKLEGKIQALEAWKEEVETARRQAELERTSMQQTITEMEEGEEELQLQIQVLTEERDAARQKEEQLFAESIEKDQEIERIRDGYVWVTDRMNSKEDELSELQEQLERYQSLMQITSPPASSATSTSKESGHLKQLYALAIGGPEAPESLAAMAKQLAHWIEKANAQNVGVSKTASPLEPQADKRAAERNNSKQVSSAHTSAHTQPTKTMGSEPTAEAQHTSTPSSHSLESSSNTPLQVHATQVLIEKRASEKESDDMEYDDDFDPDETGGNNNGWRKTSANSTS